MSSRDGYTPETPAVRRGQGHREDADHVDMKAGDAGIKRESVDNADSDADSTEPLGRRSFLKLAGVLSAVGLAGFLSLDAGELQPDIGTLTNVTYGYGGTPVATSKASQTSATATQSAARATSLATSTDASSSTVAPAPETSTPRSDTPTPISTLEDDYGEQGYGEYDYGG